MEEEIAQVPRFGARASLENLGGYLEKLGHPEKELRVIHVAGTNGKGSVCSYIDSILREAGFKTALFTSPHLQEVRERFRIDGRLCSYEKTLEAYRKVRNLMKEGASEGLLPLTYFEILFLMSLLIFREEKPDYCIMETGLGGRLDATVLTEPVLCVITSISIDHSQVLGDTVEKIAAEKAGIIKEGIPVVTIDEGTPAISVIRKEAERNRADLIVINTRELRFLKKSVKSIDFSIDCRYYKSDRLSINSKADYQVCNAALAVLSVRRLLADDPSIEDAGLEKAIRSGLLKMSWEGRMEEIFPDVYVDGAHNVGAVRQGCRQLERELAEGSSYVLVFAVCQDKDYSGMISLLAGISFEKIFITRIRGIRGADVDEVRNLFTAACDCPTETCRNVQEAMEKALAYKDTCRCEDLKVLCLGSLYMVGEIKDLAVKKERIK